MKWVLIIMLTFGGFGNSGASITTQEFNDELSCNVAATAAVTMRPDYTTVKTRCVAKGAD